jgi:hypothetical protein
MRHKTIGIGVVAALSILMLGPVAARQQPDVPAVDVETLGPQVGATVPDFSLPDQHGVTRALTSLMGPKGAILVFFRSADW